jgi:hypothetical protein
MAKPTQVRREKLAQVHVLSQPTCGLLAHGFKASIRKAVSRLAVRFFFCERGKFDMKLVMNLVASLISAAVRQSVLAFEAVAEHVS